MDTGLAVASGLTFEHINHHVLEPSRKYYIFGPDFQEYIFTLNIFIFFSAATCKKSSQTKTYMKAKTYLLRKISKKISKNIKISRTPLKHLLLTTTLMKENHLSFGDKTELEFQMANLVKWIM